MPDLITAVQALEGMADEELWRIARKTMPPRVSQDLEALHLKQRESGLSQDEDAARAIIIQEYDRTMLLRAQAGS